ncbi:MAG: YggS family pyridoxal phosphate-dependent enzyme [Campylobacter gracilis]|uniref:YggS family pyridoxal phosphate-dependent enzyme n=1 Tax=Campylobacter gracilis TaxID=824 RepID=UPI0026E91CC5|nr:YggS family pyridoxal phosphate-dependent enzyme [Campylobacter gracilis]MBS6153617.1 YggS family pyridoxal phosphate-dependent enzyme [Campylobacter gracilis]
MRLDEILKRIEAAKVGPGDVQLVAVSKNVGTDEVRELYSQGQIAFGENRVQELKRKSELLRELPLKWHFIGTLQSNKINQLIALRPTLWQSCNNYELALAVNKRLNYPLDTLLEINAAGESSKTGLDKNRAVEEFLRIKQECKNLNLIGVMSIGAHASEPAQIARSFEVGREIFDALIPHGARICSMGMSDDFELAIKCGSNMIRLGRILYA